MSRPKVKASTKTFRTVDNTCPVEHRHENYSAVIARMYSNGICSKRKAEEMKQRVDALYGEASE